MKKLKAHYDLDEVKRRVAREGVGVFTQTAIVGALRLGLTLEQACWVVLGLSRQMFYKSMTTHLDTRV